MIYMKKIIYGALVALTAISLMACSGEKKSEKKTGGEDDEIFSFSFNSDDIKVESSWVPDDSIEVKEFEGKKFSEVIKAGYEYAGCVTSLDDEDKIESHRIDLLMKVADENVSKILKEISDMTVEEFIESDYFDDFFDEIDFREDESGYIFYTQIGAIKFTFELEGSEEIIPLYEDDTFATADEMEELYDKKMLNVTLDYVEYSVLLDESANDIIALDDFEEEMLYDCTVEIMFCESFS